MSTLQEIGVSAGAMLAAIGFIAASRSPHVAPIRGQLQACALVALILAVTVLLPGGLLAVVLTAASLAGAIGIWGFIREPSGDVRAALLVALKFLLASALAATFVILI